MSGKKQGKVREKIRKLKIKISAFSLKDILKTKNLSKTREKEIAKAEESTADGTYEINRRARHLHPDRLSLTVYSVREQAGGSARTYVLSSGDGSPLPRFRAGQYISLRMRMGESMIARPYSLCSSPTDAASGRYEITVESFDGGFAGNWINSNLREGDGVVSSGPDGTLYYERLRDGENVLAVAGGSGVTPFVSMARAIRDGDEDFSLTLIYGARNAGMLYYREELESIARKCPRFRLVYVLEEAADFPCETGYITADILKKYMPGEGCAVYLCGSAGMKKFVLAQLEKAGVSERKIRAEGSPVAEDVRTLPDYPAEANVPETVRLTVVQGTEERTVTADPLEPILVSLERAGIRAPSGCRSGECGWCRARILSGGIYVPRSHDRGRRKVDRSSGYAHVCCAFPLGDVSVEIPPSDIPS